MRRGWPYGLLLLAAYLLVYLAPLSARPLFVPDETRYGEIPREMLADGDFTVPRLDGLRYFEKPPLGYWLHAASIAVFGKNRFAVRLPSALAAGMAALVILLLVRRMIPAGGDAPLPYLAGLVFLTCAEVAGVGGFAVLDSLLSLFLTLTVALFFLATEEAAGSGREGFFLAAAGVACGLAFLTKGFLALAVPAVIFVPYLLWEGRGREMTRLAWPPLSAAAAVALPWSLAVAAREPGFWHYFFWVEHVKRFMAADAQHGEPFWYYLAAAPGLFLPWSFLFPAALAGMGERLGREGGEARLLRLAVCWLVMPFLFFSAAHGKLVTYILPCFPPFAILTARGLWPGRDGRWFAAGGLFLAGLLAAAALGLAGLQLGLIPGPRPYAAAGRWPYACAALAFFALALALAARGRGRAGIPAAALGAAVLFAAVPFILPARVLVRKAPAVLIARHRREVRPDTVIISGEEPLTAVCFVLERSDVRILGPAGELSHGLSFADARGRALDPAAAAALIHAHPGGAVLVARTRNYQRWQKELPRPRKLDSTGPKGYVFVTY